MFCGWERFCKKALYWLLPLVHGHIAVFYNLAQFSLSSMEVF